MALIYLFHPETYPEEIIEIRDRLQMIPQDAKKYLIEVKYLSDYTSSAMWETDTPFGQIHAELMQELSKHEIVAYHNTRLLNGESIRNMGIIFSDERYEESIKKSMQITGIEGERIEKILSIIIHERDRWEEGTCNRRKNKICFIYDWDYYKDYDKFLAVYGGEFVEFGLSNYADEKLGLREYKDIIKIGHPYVIEFSIPFSELDFFDQQDVARYMLEEWIHLDVRHDETRHQYDGHIEREIPPEKIINIHEVKDEFVKMDEYLFKY
ncbi:MAG: hypothetical protein PHN80_15950 [Hespellia sp.]|nr:hypothetical protein [Hespellia sp.]